MRTTIMNAIKNTLILLALLAFPALALASPQVYPCGTVKYVPEKCCNGFTLIGAGTARLVDMNGNLVHEWKNTAGMPNKVYPGGMLISGSGKWKLGQQDTRKLIMMDFAGNIVWSWDKGEKVQNDKGEGRIWVARQHHDFQLEGVPAGYYAPGQVPVENGKVLILAHANTHDKQINDAQLLDDIIYEVDIRSGKVV